MNGLRRADLEAILDFLVDSSELEFSQPYPPQVVARLSDLVPSSGVKYEEVDVAARRTTVLIGVDGAAAEDEEDDGLYWELGPCPTVDYRTTTGDLAATRISDVIDRRRYLESAFYREYYKPVAIEHVIDIGLPAAAGQQRSFYFLRLTGDRDFSRRDCIVLDVLRPHFARLEAEAALRRRLGELTRSRGDEPEPGPYSHLTTREREIVELVSEGKTNAQIAAQLWVSPGTVKKHLENVYEKLGVGRRAAAASYARRHQAGTSAALSVGPDLS